MVQMSLPQLDHPCPPCLDPDASILNALWHYGTCLFLVPGAGMDSSRTGTRHQAGRRRPDIFVSFYPSALVHQLHSRSYNAQSSFLMVPLHPTEGRGEDPGQTSFPASLTGKLTTRT